MVKMSELKRTDDAMEFSIMWCPPWKIDFILNFRKLLKLRFLTGNKYIGYVAIEPDGEAHKVDWLIEHINNMSDQVDASIKSICYNLKISKECITGCLDNSNDSFNIIKNTSDITGTIMDLFA